VVTDPAGARTELSPFWDGGAWLFRWRPTQLGSHTVSIQGAVDEEHAIEVRDEGLRGPVVADGYGFRLPDGSAWTPLGVNLGWHQGDALADYEAWFDALADHGGNFARVWLSDIGDQAPEWAELGVYDPGAAARVDGILDLAEERGVGVMPVIWVHTQLETRMWSRWESNPYNAANGGPCATSLDFFVDEQALALQERYLRYLVARWSAHPAVVLWEVMNEVDGVVGVPTEVAESWASARADSLRSLDPIHPVSWSHAVPDHVEAHDWTGTDFSQVHCYLFGGLQVADAVAALEGREPILVGEFGLDWLGELNDDDPTYRSWHNANWAALAGGAASNALSWWWDWYVHPGDLWFRLDGPAVVTADPSLDLPSMGPVEIGVRGDDVVAAGRANEGVALVWVRAADSDWSDPPPGPHRGVRVDPGLVGPVGARWFDPVTGQLVGETRGEDGEVVVPAFEADVVGIVEVQPEDGGCGCRGGAAMLWLPLLLARRRRGGG